MRGQLTVNAFISMLGAYSLPETSNPFAAALLGDGWLWLALPVGVAYGLGSALLGSYLAGDVLDRRQPELLAPVTPRR